MLVTTQPALARRLGLGDAVFIGLGSMIGAGVFAAFSPAAQAAGSGLLVGLAVAALVAFCNATASAQLAAAYPTSGGTYAYGRARLGPWWGYLAGWSFIVGKTASCAAMAITFAAYAAPAGWEKPVAVIAVLALGGVNALGVTRTALLTRILVSIVLVALAVAVAAGSSTGLPAFGGALPGGAFSGGLLAGGWYGVLQSAGLLFFAFAGYARIATMGEEVHDPARTIPRAIVIALTVVVAIYGVIAVVLLGVLGRDGLAGVIRAGCGCRGGERVELGGAGRAGGGGRGIPGGIARADRGGRAHDAGHGAGGGCSALAVGGASTVPRAAPR